MLYFLCKRSHVLNNFNLLKIAELFHNKMCLTEFSSISLLFLLFTIPFCGRSVFVVLFFLGKHEESSESRFV